jgi:hypothetical protein
MTIMVTIAAAATSARLQALLRRARRALNFDEQRKMLSPNK